MNKASWLIAAVMVVPALAWYWMSWQNFSSWLRVAFQLMQSAFQELPDEIKNGVKATFYLSLPMSFLGAIGGVIYQSYGWIYGRVHAFIEKRCTVSLMFTNADQHYNIVIDYIGAKCAVETGKIRASTVPRSKPSFAEMLANWLGGKTKAPKLYYQPELTTRFWTHFDWTDNEGKVHKIWTQTVVDKPQFRSEKAKGADPETLIIALWWTTDPKPLKDFMAEAFQTMLKEDSEGKVDIYVKHMWLPIWSKAVSKDKRDRETIVLDQNLAEYVVQDLRHFFTAATADWYHNAGIPYRRGYLLYGPPGCGKTSFAQVLAGELGLDVCLLNLSNKDMDDDNLAELLRNAPPRAMLLLEDVDAIFVERSGQDKRSGVSFSGLLNALDGAAAQEGSVIVLTTNHKDRLDEALIRPGRCDVHVHIQNASQDQANRMFCRFFAPQVDIKSSEADTGIVTMDAWHGFKTGDAVMYRNCNSKGLQMSGTQLNDKDVLYVHAGALPNQRGQLRLYNSQAAAKSGTAAGLFQVSNLKGSLSGLPEVAERFSTRIPEHQVSMAKLQGYLMKQKLLAEQDFQLRHKGEPQQSDQEFKFRYDEEIRAFAQESAIMNVHELLEVKADVEQSVLPIFEHLRRVGLHTFAPLFEHFGVRIKDDMSEALLERIKAWHPDMSLDSPQKDRLVQLIKSDQKLAQDYALADLSVLRDSFITAFQNAKKSSEAAKSPPMPLVLDRARSCPQASDGVPTPSRISLIRQSSGLGSNLEDEKLNILEMAHSFQEKLETNGKTNISMYQLKMHFKRYEADPVGALENCHLLLKKAEERTTEEKTVQWMSTFEFLRRLGLENHSFQLEDAGYHLWSELRSLSKDELKDKGGMPDKAAQICHAVLSGDSNRPDLLRNFQIPEFGDLVEMFSLQFPSLRAQQAQEFAKKLTDELGITAYSCKQIQEYLAKAASPTAALSLESLFTLAAAEAARVKPEAPPPPKEPDDWLYNWLKAQSLQGNYQSFSDQALVTEEDLLRAPLTCEDLEKIGIRKLGERRKLLAMIKELN